MSTILCPNKLCGKEISGQFEKCPFCGTPLNDVANKKVESVSPKTVKRKPAYVPLSGWHTFATIMLVLSALVFVGWVFVSVLEGDEYFIIGLVGFVVIFLLCGIVQLLAGIKRGIDKLYNK